MKSLLRNLFFRQWLKHKTRQESSDWALSMPIEVMHAERDTVVAIAPSLSLRQQYNVTHRRLQLAAVGLKSPSFEIEMMADEMWNGVNGQTLDMNDREWWDDA